MMCASKTKSIGERSSRRLSWWVIPIVVFVFLIGIPVTTWLVGRGVDGLLGLPLFPMFPFNLVVGYAVIVCAGLLCWGSMYQLYRGGRGYPWGDVDDAAQSTELVTTGLYRYTRNPMILGFLLLLSGIGWVVQSITAMLIIPLIAFVLLWAWLKRREEPKLEQRFGDAYRTYKARTPLIVPRPWRRSKPTNDEGD